MLKSELLEDLFTVRLLTSYIHISIILEKKTKQKSVIIYCCTFCFKPNRIEINNVNFTNKLSPASAVIADSQLRSVS